MKSTTTQKLRYSFDSFMSRGIGSMMIGLLVVFLASLGLVTVIRLGIFFLFGQRGQYQQSAPHLAEGEQLDQDPLHHIYLTFLQMTDPGNMAQDIAAHPIYHISAIISGMVGVILLSALVGLITTWLMSRMEQLRKGHSTVIEEAHTVILGWEPQRILEILRELVEANESEKRAAVCILAEEDKEVMDDYLAVHLPIKERLSTQVVTRSGSISSITNLQIVSVTTCRSVIVLSSCNQSAPVEKRQQSDARVVKAVMAVSSCEWENPDEEEYDDLNIVAEIFDQSHREIVMGACNYQVTVVDAWDILAKIIVQTSRSVGLSVAYGELLSFEGCEMYFHEAEWGGGSFGEIQFHFPDGVPIGIRNDDGIFINPPLDRVLAEGDQILIVADDDSTIEFRDQPVARPSDNLPFHETKLEQKVEDILIIGWNHMAPIIIEQYSDYILEGSTITVMLDDPDEAFKKNLAQLAADFPSLKLFLVAGDAFKFDELNKAKPSKMDNIIILNKSGDSTDSEKTDSETILILLMLRSIFEKDGVETPPKLVAEVADSKNQTLVSNSGVRDFIISNRLVSMVLAQISEEADIKHVYDDLFAEDGSEIYLKPLSLYLHKDEIPEALTFADCMRLAQLRGEICIGIKQKSLETAEDANFGVELIPLKDKAFCFGPDDCLVVVSEDET